MSWRPLPTIKQIQDRLELVFPRAAFDSTFSNPAAAWSVAALLYVDAVVPFDGDPPETTFWLRPSMVLWLQDEVYARSDEASRAAWRTAAGSGKGRKAVVALLREWGLTHSPKYADNSREGPRDETFPPWVDEGAMRLKAGVPVTSPKGRWALTDAFADLFDPTLAGDALIAAVDSYRDTHMSPPGRVRALTERRRRQKAHAVEVKLPDGTIRFLEPGDASLILKGVIEDWAPIRLVDGVVLTISEPGTKMLAADAATIQSLGISIDPTTLLPDALLVDVGQTPPNFWIVEVVYSDGVIDESRRNRLLAWAQKQRIPEGSCYFLTAFMSRNADPARRRLKDLAAGTFAWYLDEPGHELAWYRL
jgi:hypothetical protein